MVTDDAFDQFRATVMGDVPIWVLQFMILQQESSDNSDFNHETGH